MTKDDYIRQAMQAIQEGKLDVALGKLRAALLTD